MVSAGGSSLELYTGPTFISEVAWTGGAEGCSVNDGGTGGGVSAYYAAPSYMAVPGSKRPVPDIALNADSLYEPQNFYFNGSLTGTGAAPASWRPKWRASLPRRTPICSMPAR